MYMDLNDICRHIYHLSDLQQLMLGNVIMIERD